MSVASDPDPRLVVVIRVTTRCSMGCLYCGFSRELERSRSDLSFDRLSRLGRALAGYRDSLAREVHVSWLGGEPFEWSDLRAATELFAGELGFSVGVTTAGLQLAKPQVRSWALDRFAELTLSIDGAEPDHDQLRKIPGGFRRLESVCKALVQERRANAPRLRINMVLTRSTIERFESACRFFADWGFDEITFNQLGGNDRPEFYPTNRLMPEQVERFMFLLPALRSEMLARGVTISGGDAYWKRFRATAENERLAIEDCEPGDRFLFIDETGRAAPCSFTALEYGVSIDALQSAEDFQRLPQHFRSLRQSKRCSACSDCHATHVFDKFDRMPQPMSAFS